MNKEFWKCQKSEKFIFWKKILKWIKKSRKQTTPKLPKKTDLICRAKSFRPFSRELCPFFIFCIMVMNFSRHFLSYKEFQTLPLRNLLNPTPSWSPVTYCCSYKVYLERLLYLPPSSPDLSCTPVSTRT